MKVAAELFLCILEQQPYLYQTSRVLDVKANSIEARFILCLALEFLGACTKVALKSYVTNESVR